MRIEDANIYMIRGDTEDVKVSCKNALGEVVPFVAGDTLYFTVKKSTNITDKIFQKIVTEFTDGIAYIPIAHLDTEKASFGEYFYDIQLTKADGTVKTIIPPSAFVLEPEVTYE